MKSDARGSWSQQQTYLFGNRQEASRLLQECTISQYMEKVLQRRDEEDLRSRKLLHPSSYSRVRGEYEQRMVTDHMLAIHNECPVMVQQELLQDLCNAYALLKVSPRFQRSSSFTRT